MRRNTKDLAGLREIDEFTKIIPEPTFLKIFLLLQTLKCSEFEMLSIANQGPLKSGQTDYIIPNLYEEKLTMFLYL